MARCARTIGESLPRRRAWADITSDEEEEEPAVFTLAFQAPVPPTTVKAEETDSNSSLEVTRGGSCGSEDSGDQADRLSEELHGSLQVHPEAPTETEPVTEDLDQVDDEAEVPSFSSRFVNAATSPRHEPEPPEALEPPEPPPSPPTSSRSEAVREAMKMMRVLREFAQEHPEPEVHEIEIQSSLQSKDVEKLRNIRARLLAQRQAKETAGLLPQRKAELEANRAKVAKLRQELSDVLKTREVKAKQEAEELAALHEANAAQDADTSSPKEGQASPVAETKQEQLKAELQRMQAENQELLRAAQQVRSEDTGSRTEVQVLHAEANKLKLTLHEYREGTAEMEIQLAELQHRKAEKLTILHDVRGQRKKIEEEHKVLEQKVKEEKQRSQQLENEKVSLQSSVKEAEEACRVWEWRLRKELCQIERTEPNCNFVVQLLNKAPEVAEG